MEGPLFVFGKCPHALEIESFCEHQKARSFTEIASYRSLHVRAHYRAGLWMGWAELRNSSPKP